MITQCFSSTSDGGSGIPFSSSISACVFPHNSLVIENVAGRCALVCNLEHSNGRNVKFLVKIETVNNRVHIVQIVKLIDNMTTSSAMKMS